MSAQHTLAVGDRVEYMKPRYGDPPPCYGTVREINSVQWLVLVEWEGTTPYPTYDHGNVGWHPVEDVALQHPPAREGQA